MGAVQFRATRLAPSPTGALHLGHARTFLITWWMARQAGAKIFMRMEDLDAGRAKPESVQQAYDDLQWLGMEWDGWNSQCRVQNSEFGVEGSQVEDGVVVQSRRIGVYERVLEELWRRGAVYPCTCTRAEIAAAVMTAASAPHEGEANVRYPGICRKRGEDEGLRALTVRQAMQRVREATGKDVCWRLRVRDGVVDFDDLFFGSQGIDVAGETGDFPVTRFSTGEAPLPPAYQLACVVDDHAMGIDLVIRGDDLLSSTPRQMLIYQALGWELPRFCHVPLVVGADGKRLAKRHGESRIAQFQAAGVSPERVVGWAAWRSGQAETLSELPAPAIIGGFELDRVPRERVVVGTEKLGCLG